MCTCSEDLLRCLPFLWHLFLSSASQDFSSKTLKRTRKFVVDGVEVSVTTSKIIRDDEKKDEEMRFLRYVDVYRTHHQYTNLICFQTHVLSASPSFGSVSSVFIPTNEVHGLSRPRLRVKSAHWWVAATQTISGILLFWALAPWDCELRKYPNSYGCSLRLHTVCGLGEKSLWSEIRSAVLIVGILAV